ncbi:hypothetical protein PP914_gp193 [Arthrobacter phage Qui]|uniref:Uncharacterized protein n=1 Tax=Arthrobacter phage Qui TaxID=2603260 RepID=A0A5B8WH98_9CAUD|nr:hypothetical protein PP914_gp193 [Arthrobacter phage Qui]QED11681.1 hypothetical protein SEA_QUI_193 [Arthrobacter phage Qui]QOC56512.1 hypothetical protein SEA_PAELLA_193 [Arthrobacter phage Paella]
MRFPNNTQSTEVVSAPEPSYMDRLYIQFGMSMTEEHWRKFNGLTRERKDYLFDLWLKTNGYV